MAAERALYFTTQRAGRRVDIMRLSLADGRISTVLADAGAANGMTLDRDGRLLVCEQQPAAISRIDPATGERETVVDAFRGPAAELAQRRGREVRRQHLVHRPELCPSAGLRARAAARRPRLPLRRRARRWPRDGFEKPNGLAFSPDESVLYVGDSEACVIDAFDVLHGRVLANRRRFATIERGYPDGLKTDRRGNVYTTGGAGLLVFSPAGALLREIDLPGAVNFAFAGDRLLVTADDAIWSIPLQGA